MRGYQYSQLFHQPLCSASLSQRAEQAQAAKHTTDTLLVQELNKKKGCIKLEKGGWAKGQGELRYITNRFPPKNQ